MAASDSRVKGRNKRCSSSDRDDESSDIAACVGAGADAAACLLDTECKSRLLTLLVLQDVDSDDGGQLLYLQFPCRRRLSKLLSLLKTQLLF